MVINELKFKFKDFNLSLITLYKGENLIIKCVAKSISIFSLILISGLV
jgi:hypothetical protein